jgi:ribosomal protein L12E/L44/L45/RPP1/RPP2
MPEKELETSPVFSTRIDLKKMAALAKYYAKAKGELGTINRSEMLRELTEGLHDLLLKQGKMDPVLSYEEALTVLSSHGITFTQGSRSHQAVINALHKESLETGGLLRGGENALAAAAQAFMKNYKAPHEREQDGTSRNETPEADDRNGESSESGA